MRKLAEHEETDNCLVISENAEVLGRSNFDHALSEAQSAARAHPGKKFTVWQAVAVVEAEAKVDVHTRIIKK